MASEAATELMAPGAAVSPRGWDTLPEVVQIVANYLLLSELLMARQVCRLWQRAFDFAGGELVLNFPFLTEVVRRASAARFAITKVSIEIGPKHASTEPEYLTVWARCLRCLEQLPRATTACITMPWRRKLFTCLAAGLPHVESLTVRCSGALIDYGTDSHSGHWRLSSSSVDLGGAGSEGQLGRSIDGGTGFGRGLGTFPGALEGLSPLGCSPPSFVTAPRPRGNGLSGLSPLTALHSLEIDVIAGTDIADLALLTRLTMLSLRLRELDWPEDSSSGEDCDGRQEDEDVAILRLPLNALGPLTRLTGLKDLAVRDERDQGCKQTPLLPLLQPLTVLTGLLRLELHTSSSAALGRPPTRATSGAPSCDFFDVDLQAELLTEGEEEAEQPEQMDAAELGPSASCASSGLGVSTAPAVAPVFAVHFDEGSTSPGCTTATAHSLPPSPLGALPRPRAASTPSGTYARSLSMHSDCYSQPGHGYGFLSDFSGLTSALLSVCVARTDAAEMEALSIAMALGCAPALRDVTLALVVVGGRRASSFNSAGGGSGSGNSAVASSGQGGRLMADLAALLQGSKAAGGAEDEGDACGHHKQPGQTSASLSRHVKVMRQRLQHKRTLNHSAVLVDEDELYMDGVGEQI